MLSDAARCDRDEFQKIYENQVRARAELNQFYVALLECNSSEHYVTHDKLLSAVRRIDGKLAQIISTLETEKNVSCISLGEMAECMQYENEREARRYAHDHPAAHIFKSLAGAYIGNVCAVGVSVPLMEMDHLKRQFMRAQFRIQFPHLIMRPRIKINNCKQLKIDIKN